MYQDRALSSMSSLSDVCRARARVRLNALYLLSLMSYLGCSGSTLDDADPRNLSVTSGAGMSGANTAPPDSSRYDLIVINEINAQSAPHDWVELANLSDAPVDLTGCFISDDLAHPQQTIFTQAMRVIVPAQGFLVVSVTDATLGFKLGKDDAVILTTPAGIVIDQYQYTHVESQAHETISRVPNFTGVMIPTPATPGRLNSEVAITGEVTGVATGVATGEESVEATVEERGEEVTEETTEETATDDDPVSLTPVSNSEIELAPHDDLPLLFINEIAAKGEPEDWVELYNMGEMPVSLIDLQITDDLEADEFFVFDARWDEVPSGGIVVVEISEETVGFKLGKDEAFYLLDAHGEVIDSVDWEEGDSPDGGSFARFPDGDGDFSTSAQHSRGIQNQ